MLATKLGAWADESAWVVSLRTADEWHIKTLSSPHLDLLVNTITKTTHSQPPSKLPSQRTITMLSYAPITLALAALSHALPSPSGLETRAVTGQQLATYDDIKAVPAENLLNPISSYKGLTYTGFQVLVEGVAGSPIAGIRPASGDQVLSNGVVGDILSGQPSFKANKGKLDLESIFFACTAETLESAANVPVACTVAFTAFPPNSDTASDTVNHAFNPTDALLSDMTKATFPSSFKNAERIEMSVVSSVVTETLTSFFIDNNAYRLHA